MQTDTVCGQCGEPIYNEDTNNRKPCPKCGSTKRKYSLTLAVQASASVTVTAEVFRPASAFLDVATALASSDDRMDWNLSVVAALVACEIATERTIVEVAKANGKQSAAVSQRNRDRTFKMQDPKTRALYKQLTGDDTEQPADDWRKHVAGRDLRHSIVHEGLQTSRKDAADFLTTATRFANRLEKHRSNT